ncbi:MAG: acyltransferase [Microbacteriaceae bacterium]|nr:acyltransferase [Microbacteriaceae bacterium]
MAVGTKSSSKRGDIQGLRAVAVALVVGYHFFPGRLHGGFIGVDIFFVISGFLITLHLIKEIDRTGRISLATFYAKRIRRLMPASLAVTIVTVIAALLLSAPLQRADTLHDAAWATAYLANFHLAQSPQGYFAATDPSLFTHFWSLAVEEQYYLLWPLILTAIVLAARARWRNVAGVVLALILAGSLVASVMLTAAGSNDAYYSLGTRAWELAIGGAVSLIVFFSKRVPSARITSAAAVLGVLAILGAAYKFSDLTPFPSWTAAIPTVGTALIIWAGSHHTSVISRALSIRPARFLGDISYSLYLWHWPVLILATPFIPATQLGRLATLAIAVLLAVVSYYGIERQGMQIPLSMRAPRVMAAGLTVAAATVVALTLGATAFPTTGGPSVARAASIHATIDVVHSEANVSGLTVRILPQGLPANVVPSLGSLATDLAPIFTNGCLTGGRICEGGDPTGTKSVVLAGDSQIGQWWPAVNKAAIDNGWKLYIVAHDGCPFVAMPIPDGVTGAPRPTCTAWQSAAAKAVTNLRADVVLYANNQYGYQEASRSSPGVFEQNWTAGVEKTLGQFTAVSNVVYFGQFPTLSHVPGACLFANLTAVGNCATPLNTAVPPDIRALDVKLAASGNAIYFDPSALLCSEKCEVVDHNRIMYHDGSHLTGSYATLFAPALADVIRAALKQ